MNSVANPPAKLLQPVLRSSWKLVLVAIGVTLVVVFAGIQASAQSNHFVPKDGFIPDQKTAVSVAAAVLDAIYGEKQIASERPFSATLRDGIWSVVGTLPKGARNGGVAEIKISKAKGCIISVTHGM